MLMGLARSGIAGLAVLAAVTCSGGLAGDWPQWRGPERDGQADPADVPARWPDTLEPAWRVTAGEGHSSPIVADGRVYLVARQNGEEIARAIDLESGDVLWSTGYAAPYEVHNAAREHGHGPKATPAIADGRLFTFGISGILSCFETRDGAVLWRKDFSEQFEKTSPLFGVAVSPIVVDGKVITHVGGHDSGALMAFDVADGEEVWSWDDDGPGYASPIVMEADGVRHLITQSQTAVISINPETGELLWRVALRTSYDQNSITPLVHDGMLIYAGFQQPTVAARLKQQNGGWQLADVWKDAEIPLYMSTPVIANDLLFGFTHRNRGQLFCADANTGKVLWTGEGRSGDNAALIAAGENVLVQYTTGDLHVLQATAERPTTVARYRVSENANWAHPAIASGRLLTKDVETLTCWKLR
jgi:outer membrane protein assembly factor BamB